MLVLATAAMATAPSRAARRRSRRSSPPSSPSRCVGMYFPSLAASAQISARRVPRRDQTSFIPLNLIVVAVFLSIGRLGVTGALTCSTVALSSHRRPVLPARRHGDARAGGRLRVQVRSAPRGEFYDLQSFAHPSLAVSIHLLAQFLRRRRDRRRHRYHDSLYCPHHRPARQSRLHRLELVPERRRARAAW